MVAVSEPFGQTASGKEVQKIILRGSSGLEAHIVTFGAAVQRLLCPARTSCDPPTDVALGYDSVQQYEACQFYLGVVIGRQAGRVRQAQMPMPDGGVVKLTANQHPHSLHGGAIGLHKRLWTIESLGDCSCTLSVLSKDGDDGYPGNLCVRVTYAVLDDNSLQVRFSGECDKPCPISIASHIYFNLSGHANGTVANHLVQVCSGQCLQLDQEGVSTGQLLQLSGTDAQLATGVKLAQKMQFDHILVLDKKQQQQQQQQLAATATECSSGLQLQCHTDQPVMVFYTGGFLDSVPGKETAKYCKHAGFCFEPQQFPDTMNRKEFPTALLRPGETYRQTSTFKLLHCDV